MRWTMNKVISAIFSAGFALSAANAMAGATVVGQVGLVQGEVYLNSKAIHTGAALVEGSVIETKEGKATLILGKGSVFHVGPDSKMVVNQYDVKPSEEKGELELKFGRTRALILNQGNEKRDLKIKARAATMGVRGTEVFVDVPKDANRPAQFFTVEGSAVVQTGAQTHTVNQNQGVASSGAQGLSSGQVKDAIKSAGIQQVSVANSQTATAAAPPPPSTLSDSFGAGSIPPIILDPLTVGSASVTITPTFQSAN